MLQEYMYLSDRKVDSYAKQIGPGIAKKLKAEVSAHLGLIATRLSTIEPKSDRISRMKLVEEYITRHYDVGTTEFPGVWVKDSIKVQRIRFDRNPNVFLLLGRNDANQICALFGDSKHVVGTSAAEPLSVNASFFPDFADLVSADIEMFDKRDAELEAFGGWTFNGGVRDDEVASILYCLLEQAKSYVFEVNFLGRFVAEGSSGISGICRSFAPLYVSLT